MKTKKAISQEELSRQLQSDQLTSRYFDIESLRQMQSIFNDPLGELSPEEEQELKDLKVARKLESKRLKIESFKKLDAVTREFVIQSYQWEKAVDEINSVSAAKTARELDLRRREDFNKAFMHRTINAKSMWEVHNSGRPRLPDGLTIEDLTKAHLDATMEESLHGES